MKKCPDCNRTYSEESFSFCLHDGSILSAPYDPEETLVGRNFPGSSSRSKKIDIEDTIQAVIDEVYEHLYGHQNLDDAAKQAKLEELSKEFHSVVTPYTSPQEAILRFLESKRLA